MMKIPASDLQPGQRFEYRRDQYVRATEDEALRHPARELQQTQPDLVLVYMLGREKRTPSSFVPDAMVVPR